MDFQIENLGSLLSKGIKIALIVLFGILAYEILKYFISQSVSQYVKRVYKEEDVGRAELRMKTLHGVLYSTLKSLIIFLAAVLILYEIGVLKAAPFAALAGFLGIAFGFGSQNLARDLINGFFIILEDQFRKGDYIKLESNIEGEVYDLNIRRTILKKADGKMIFIPNSEIKIIERNI